MVESFSTSDEFSKASQNSYYQRRQVESPVQAIDVNVVANFSILIRKDVLVAQAYTWADAVLKSSIDPRKLFNSYASRNMSHRVLLAQVYIYSLFKGYYLGLDYSVTNFDTNSNLLLRGHAQLYELLKAKTFTTISSEYSDCVRRLDVIEEDRNVNDAVYESFSSWLDARNRIGELYTFEMSSFEAILFNMKNLARNNASNKIGLEYWIEDINNLTNSVVDPDRCFLGNLCYARKTSRTLNVINSDTLKIFNDAQIINPALFVTQVSEIYGTGDVLHTVYRSLNFDNSNHVRRYEVEAVTGLRCNTIPSISKSDWTALGLVLPTSEEGQNSGNGGRP